VSPLRASGRGLMAEILGGLALVMIAAMALLGAMLAVHHDGQQRELLARVLATEAANPARTTTLVPDTAWWQVEGDGSARPRDAAAGPIDPESRELAVRAREAGASLLQMGPPWGQVRFATPLGPEGRVAVARLPASALPGAGAAPRFVALAILAIDAGIFIAFGASLLRRRVVLPLRRLAAAARAQADGATDVRAPVEGARETVEVALAFNEMTDALAARTGELEKAVSELRRANREVREAQAGLARAERLAAVGRLAAGVAHEVGNPMGALLAFLDLAGRDPGLSDASRSHLARAGAQVERVRKILRQMLDFSRPGKHSTVSFDLGAVMDETAGLLRAQMAARGIRLTTLREASPPAALGDPGAAAQILLNLALNAADAVEGRADACVEILLRPANARTRAGGALEAARGRRAADTVECLVSDNGPGVSAEDRERIFDPFFTTKPPGQGTGLGLSNALRLAEEIGGTLELASADQGACFLLRLPAAGPATDCGVRTRVRAEGARGDPAAGSESQG
jgi:two-component system NtrC family sensor kinase